MNDLIKSFSFLLIPPTKINKEKYIMAPYRFIRPSAVKSIKKYRHLVVLSHLYFHGKNWISQSGFRMPNAREIEEACQGY